VTPRNRLAAAAAGGSASTGNSAPQGVKNAKVIELQSMQRAKKALRIF
jgi:hypothetical protein